MADPYTTPVPGSSGIAGAVNAAKLAYQQALAQIGKSRGDLLRSAGYQADFDPNSGKWSNLRVDGTNQYGGLQRMLRTHALQDEAAQEQAQERGIRGGLANQAASQLSYEHGGQAAEFGSAVAGGLGAFEEQQRQAKAGYDNALYEAQLEATRRAIAERLFNQGDFSDVPEPTYGAETFDPTPPPAADQGVPGGPGGALTLNPPPGVFDGQSAEDYNQHILDTLASQTPAKASLIRTLVNPPAPAKAEAPVRYYTYKKDVHLRPGQKLAFRAGKGYYAAPK